MSQVAPYQKRIKELVSKAFGVRGFVTNSLLKKMFPEFRTSIRSSWYDIAFTGMQKLTGNDMYCIGEINRERNETQTTKKESHNQKPLVEIQNEYGKTEVTEKENGYIIGNTGREYKKLVSGISLVPVKKTKWNNPLPAEEIEDSIYNYDSMTDEWRRRQEEQYNAMRLQFSKKLLGVTLEENELGNHAAVDQLKAINSHKRIRKYFQDIFSSLKSQLELKGVEGYRLVIEPSQWNENREYHKLVMGYINQHDKYLEKFWFQMSVFVEGREEYLRTVRFYPWRQINQGHLMTNEPGNSNDLVVFDGNRHDLINELFDYFTKGEKELERIRLERKGIKAA